MREKKITFTYLSEKCGYTPQHLSRVINGHRRITDKLFKLISMALLNHLNCDRENITHILENLWDQPQ